MVEKTPLGTFWPSLHEPFRNLGGKLAEWFAPVADASSGDDAYRITMELPGVAEDDISLTVENGTVVVRGEKKIEREDRGDTWYFSERQYGAFQRSFRVPADADGSAVSAELKDGVLNITVPRKAPTDKGGTRVRISKG